MDIIEDGLYLGSRPRNCDLPKLRKAKIKAILTVDMSPLEDAIFNNYKRLYIKLADDPSQNLLSVLEEALLFIEENIQEGAVLVHCLAGVSRSASVVIAYVMRKYGISYNDAFYRVTRMRSVCPNSGFINQLKLFESMNFTVDETSPLYKQFENKVGAFQIVSPQVVGKPRVTTVDTRLSNSIYYACRKCRKVLFHSDALVHHTIKDSYSESCKSGELFTESLDWTSAVTHEIEGKLNCPRCNAKVGSYNWCGEPCTCGRWVTPAFHFSRKNLDELRTLTAGSEAYSFAPLVSTATLTAFATEETSTPSS